MYIFNWTNFIIDFKIYLYERNNLGSWSAKFWKQDTSGYEGAPKFFPAWKDYNSQDKYH